VLHGGASALGLKEQLTIMKYVIKDAVINPVIRSKSGVVYIVFMALGFTALLASLASSPGRGGPAGTPISYGIRAFLLAHGLNRFAVADMVSAALTAITVLAFALTPPKVSVRGAEYELVLTQPIEVRDFIMGKALVSATQQFMFVPYILSMLIISSFIAPNPTKALLAILSFLLISTYFTLLDTATNLVALALARRGLRKAFRAACLAYLAVGLAHTALLKYPSPILAVPLKPLAASLTYSLAISPSVAEVGGWLALSLIPIAAIFALIPPLADAVEVEDLKPLALPGGVRRGAVGGKRVRGRQVLKGLDLSSPGRAVMSVMYYSSILSVTHLRSLAAAITVPAAACLATRYFLPAWVTGVVGFTAYMVIPLATALTLTSLLNIIMVRDLMTYWIYRVYLANMKPAATALLLKVFTYTMEAVVVMATSITALTLNPIDALIIPVAAPAAALTSFAALALVTYFASKRKIVKQAPTGMYVMESSIVFIVEIFFIATLVAAPIITRALAASSTTTLLTVASAAAAATATLILGLKEILAKLMERYDIVT